jgi:hypothetical protein
MTPRVLSGAVFALRGFWTSTCLRIRAISFAGRNFFDGTPRPMTSYSRWLTAASS